MHGLPCVGIFYNAHERLQVKLLVFSGEADTCAHHCEVGLGDRACVPFAFTRLPAHVPELVLIAKFMEGAAAHR